MPQTMTIREPVLNVHPNVRNGPILGHTLELVVPARVSGGLFARRVDSPAFSWWETITFWDLVNGSWIQRGASTGPVDQALGANNTADFWRNRFSNAVDDPNWNSTWPKNPTNKEAEQLIAHYGLNWNIKVYDNPGMNNPRRQRHPGQPRNLARSVEFDIRVGNYSIRKTQVLVSSVRGDCQWFLNGIVNTRGVYTRLP
ncbi:hypothetical protein [Oxalobacter formigenes]|uniref:Uncharacterized protein n=1 Tax=Oxalobacter formigenes OXCC13 TaxID=556269 RepID=C3X872_OXAFO|nr:hypothetical protein [Oxalobacter formigenes]ARQ46566.1 hypothetical protein BRW83_1825 [Oxalobacter formigenes]ARQ78650.1 hypothetical protein BRW84_08550 [Oxalobacter formigenes OXCC13]EEO29398.1 hypothetical protein OFBG_00426 [Oxalobacter formigenes OXCC13]MCZ4061779.1 hypothetical protein [Oxalobacter formigenes]WAW01059.1 hypothetical protein NB644_08905 [Oxalobacter formigenes]